jgi:hypothetical protein
VRFCVVVQLWVVPRVHLPLKQQSQRKALAPRSLHVFSSMIAVALWLADPAEAELQ